MAGPSATDDVRSFTMRVYKHHMREARKGSLMVSLKNPEKRTCTETSISRDQHFGVGFWKMGIVMLRKRVNRRTRESKF